MSVIDFAEAAHIRARTRSEPPESVDVAIVGCGIGGLTAAAYLARSGLKVACFDSHYVAGGCTTQFERGPSDGRYHFDIGLHYVGDCTEKGAIPTMLRGAGVEVDWLPMDQNGFDTLIFPGLRFAIPANIELYRDRLVALFPKEKKGIDRYVQLLREVDHFASVMEARKKPSALKMVLDLALHGRLLARYRGATIAQFLDTCTQDPGLRAIFLGQSGDYGVPPSECSVLMHMGLAAHYFKGAYYPKGGGQVLADRLADSVEAAGGTIHLRMGIEKILIENEVAVGIRTEPRKGQQYTVRAGKVLSNADIKRTLLELVGPENLPQRWVERTQTMQMGGALFMTCLGVQADMAQKGMAATNYWQFDSFDVEAFYRDCNVGGQITPRGCYITSTTFKDPTTTTHSPAGICNIEVMTLVPGGADAWGVPKAQIDGGSYRKDGEYKERKDQVQADMIRRLEAIFPGTAEHIVFAESASPVTHSRYTRASDGTGYGLAATPGQFMNERPGYRAPVSGLYLCGASTRAGHGIVGAMRSGVSAAKRIAQDMGNSL